MLTLNGENWIETRKSNLRFYDDFDLFFFNHNSKRMTLYKATGLNISHVTAPLKGELFIRAEDKRESLNVLHQGFSEHLNENIENMEVAEVKKELESLVDETLQAPRAGGLETVPQTIKTILSGYSDKPEILAQFVQLADSDYTTTIHSINVMALTLNYCLYMKMDDEQSSFFGLAALLHDIGKTEIPKEILNSPRKLSPSEWDIIKSHTTLGAEILQANDPSIHCVIPGALEHHEKLDSSGYPNGITEISEIGQTLAIIDSYEALTNDERRYRNAMKPVDALSILKEDANNGKLNWDIFKNFVNSLGDSLRAPA